MGRYERGGMGGVQRFLEHRLAMDITARESLRALTASLVDDMCCSRAWSRSHLLLTLLHLVQLLAEPLGLERELSTVQLQLRHERATWEAFREARRWRRGVADMALCAKSAAHLVCALRLPGPAARRTCPRPTAVLCLFPTATRHVASPLNGPF